MLSHKSQKAHAPSPKASDRTVSFYPSAAQPPTPLGAEIAATMRLAWPMVLTNLAQVGMTTTDLMFIGRLGPQALAAGVLALNLYMPFFIFAIGYLSAIAPIAARERGRMAHSVRAVRASVRQGFWATAVFSLISLLALFHGETLLVWLGQDAALAAEAGAYLRWLMWSLPAQMGYVTLRSFFAALERPMAALIAIAVGFLVNVAANYAFVFGRLGAPEMAVPGSGVATTIASFAQLAVLAGLAFTDRRARRYHVFGRFWRGDRAALAALARLGAPIGLTMLFEAGAFNAAVFLMGRIGEAALAAHAIAIQVATVTFMTSVGFSQAASVRVAPPVVVMVICQRGAPAGGSAVSSLPDTVICLRRSTSEPNASAVMGVPLAVTVTSYTVFPFSSFSIWLFSSTCSVYVARTSSAPSPNCTATDAMLDAPMSAGARVR